MKTPNAVNSLMAASHSPYRRNFSLVAKILSDEKFCLWKFFYGELCCPKPSWVIRFENLLVRFWFATWNIYYLSLIRYLKRFLIKIWHFIHKIFTLSTQTKLMFKGNQKWTKYFVRQKWRKFCPALSCAIRFSPFYLMIHTLLPFR